MQHFPKKYCSSNPFTTPMKRLFILTFICLSSLSQAQIFIMPSGGVSLSNVSFSDEIRNGFGNTPRFNLATNFGLAVNIPVAGPFSVQPELRFAQKGFKYLYEEFGSDYEETEDNRFILNYLELPVLGSLQFGDENVQAIINLGPYVSYGIGGKYKNKYEYKDLENNELEEMEGKIKFGDDPEEEGSTDIYVDNAFDFGFQAGLGVGISAGPGFIVFEQRFTMGLLNLENTDDGDGGTLDKAQVKSQNRSFYASLGYTISFGGGAEDGGGERHFGKKRRLWRR